MASANFPAAGGALGAAEGVSYLVVLGIVGWSAYTKVRSRGGRACSHVDLGSGRLSVFAFAIAC